MLATTRDRRRRSGTTAVEAAIVFPVFFALLLGGILVVLDVFAWHEAARLARESARWAALQGSPAPTSETIRTNVLEARPTLVKLDDLDVTTASDSGEISVTISFSTPWIGVVGSVASTARFRNPY